jgi:hypothetical protein
MEEGLDLTVSNTASRIHSDNEDDFFEDVEDDYDDNEGSIASDESGESTGSKTMRRKRKQPSKSIISQPTRTAAQSEYKSGVACGSGSSRRKPVAPQWFNPSWHDDSDDEEVLINGVCVLQNPLNYGKGVNKDTLRVEPTSPAEPPKMRFKTESEDYPAAGTKSDEEGGGVEDKLKSLRTKGGESGKDEESEEGSNKGADTKSVKMEAEEPGLRQCSSADYKSENEDTD